MNDFQPIEIGDDLTRRHWLLILGRLATVAGFSGVVPELTAALSGAEGRKATPLPPGLYHPSQEHLSQALSDLGSMHNIPMGSETEYVQPNSLPFRPQFFSDEELKLVARVLEVLLGNVNAGALAQAAQWLDLYLHSAAGVRKAALNLDALHRALAVAYYGEAAVRDLETADPQDDVRSGLTALQQNSMERYGRGFLALDEEQQAELVLTISTASPDTPLRKFFEVMRADAVRGYYTTADGLKELGYKGNWYYASCPGCEQEIENRRQVTTLRLDHQ
jgi:Gluconate 2-dehydrogenase subunit 3